MGGAGFGCAGSLRAGSRRGAALWKPQRVIALISGGVMLRWTAGLEIDE